MTMRIVRTAAFCAFAGAFLALAVHSPAVAQGSIDASNLSERGRTDGGSDGGAHTAHVGAGTTNGSTNGFSGPKKPTVGSPSEITLPPLPDKSMCDSYQNTPAHSGCLRVVLRQNGR
jgi:hypothetical protein